MASVANLEIGRPTAHSERLLECLRERVKPYDVEIQAGDGGVLLVADVTGGLGDLHAFLVVKLDECTRDTGLDWDRYIRVVAEGEQPG